MWDSQLQITAETYHKAFGSPQTIQTIFQKHYSSSLASHAIAHNHVGHTAATRSENSNNYFIKMKVVETSLSRAVTLN